MQCSRAKVMYDFMKLTCDHGHIDMLYEVGVVRNDAENLNRCVYQNSYCESLLDRENIQTYVTILGNILE